MPLTKGQIIFALLFAVGFAIALFIAYRKDVKGTKHYYKGSWKLVLGLMGGAVGLYFIVRLLNVAFG